MNTKRQAIKYEVGLPMRAKGLFALFTLTAAALSGCGAIPASKYYQLNSPREESPAITANPIPVTLLVGPLKASHLYREDRIVYATDSQEMGTYQTHRWAAPPTEMMRELLWRSLRASHQYAAVNLLTSNAQGDFLLQGNLYDFKEISGSTVLARVNLELELRDLKTGAIVWAHGYSHDEPVKGKDVSSVVAALDENAQRCVREAETDLGGYFVVHPKK